MYTHPEFKDRKSFHDRLEAFETHVVYGDLMGRPEWGKKMQELVPEHMRLGFLFYIAYGTGMGGFGSALLSNDLMGAYAKGDEMNIRCMKDWVNFLYNYAPSGCYGSKENYTEWEGMLREEADA